MEIFEILDADEQRQLRLLQFLLRQSKPLSFGALTQQLAQSPATLHSDLSALCNRLVRLEGGLTLDLTDDVIVLHGTHQWSAQEIDYYCFFERSLSYRLLIDLLIHPELSLVQRAEMLHISRATLARRIRELNGHLEEFQVQIKAGRLVGSEPQIRHLFVQWIWATVPYDLIVSQIMVPSGTAVIEGIERRSPGLFSWDGTVRMQLYFAIMKARAAKHTANLPRGVCLDDATPELALIRDVVATHAHATGMTWTAGEQLWLERMMMANMAFSTDSEGGRRAIAAETAKDPAITALDRTIGQLVRTSLGAFTITDDVFDMLSYSLQQSYFSVLYFNGIINVPANYIPMPVMFRVPSERVTKVLVRMRQATATIMATHGGISAEKLDELSLRYRMAMDLVIANIQDKIVVGCNFGRDRMFTEAQIELIRRTLRTTVTVDFEAYHPAHHYDAVITARPTGAAEREDSRVFIVLSPDFTPDMGDLELFLEHIYMRFLSDRYDRFVAAQRDQATED
ncbi:helix-turn-helix domain-containing protein [Lacticaseibacillus yichunensis]|uniref:Helix-turn-helix domain-containing protein n=1 Tax=Lacticaseibacillus yichunensis TaxID=2486015 RepID=A0ABW4CNE1_9LACO|nr:helix-turn-helix domain-containing protein [Lacticaseibacillus yichunensis]